LNDARNICRFDGSNSSLRALRWALAESEAHGDAVELVTVLDPCRVPSVTTAAVGGTA
jgi:hypothetical protein